ncbi:chromosome segregation protein Spc25-domain-containing protein [Lipomyces arxii]|uniref:chromosome segregation protein Spc25-domain-containing protein n=1 Tax=Lipomyces arxii TaxID=56418 RepID=UPI0034CD1CA7
MASVTSITAGVDSLYVDSGVGKSDRSSATTLPDFVFDFDNLRRKMDSFQSKFDQYIATDRKRILSDRNKFEKEIAEAKEQEQHMLNQIEYYKEKEQEVAHENARETEEVQETEQSITEFTKKKQELSVLRDAVVRQISETQQLLEKKREERAQERSKLLVQSSQNAPELQFWEQNLGLRFEGVQDDYLKAIFWLLCESNWDKEYQVVIDLTSRDYEISNCEPALPRSVLDDITARLNESRDFGRFLKEIRNAFKDSSL